MEPNVKLNGSVAKKSIPTFEEASTEKRWSTRLTTSTEEISIPESEDTITRVVASESQRKVLEAAITRSDLSDDELSADPRISVPSSVPDVWQPSKAPEKPASYAPAKTNKKRAVEDAGSRLREQCRQLCLTLFYQEQAPVRSLGFTSSSIGEGKTFLAMLTAGFLAHDSGQQVTLLDCNWEHPCIHQHYGVAASPGLAEWLRGECSEAAIRHTINPNLTVIPAGDGKREAVKLLRQLRQKGLLETVVKPDELLVVDLPAISTSGYGPLAAGLLESLLLVVHAGVTPGALIAETCNQLESLPVHGIFLNQVESNIPLWIRKML